MVNVAGYGAYLPVYRIRRRDIAEQHGGYPRDGEITVPSYDEDHITMGVEAGEAALSHADVGPDQVEAVYVSSVSDPFDNHGIAPHVAYATCGDGDVRVADYGGSARSATNALVAAADAVESGDVDTALIVGTEIVTAEFGSEAEYVAGSGAAAFILTRADRDSTATAKLEGWSPETSGFVGRFSVHGEDPARGDQSFNREIGYVKTVLAAIDRLRDRGFDVSPNHVTLPSPDPSWGDRVIQASEFDAERHATFADVGYAESATVLLDTVAAFEAADPDEQVLVTSYGPGGCDVLMFTAASGADIPPPSPLSDHLDQKQYVPYATHRRYRDRARGEV